MLLHVSLEPQADAWARVYTTVVVSLACQVIDVVQARHAIEHERISVTFHSNNGSPNVFASRLTHEQVLPGKQTRVYYRLHCAIRDVRTHIRLDTITGNRLSSTQVLETGFQEAKKSELPISTNKMLSKGVDVIWWVGFGGGSAPDLCR